MGWFALLLVGLVTGGFGGLLAFFVGSWAAEARRVSNMEGMRAYLIVFLLVPLGFLFGLIAGHSFAYQSHAGNFAEMAKQQGLALLWTAAIIGAAGALAYVTADHPPKIAGKELSLEFEIRMPRHRRLPKDLKQLGLGASLSANGSDTHAAFLQFDAANERDGCLIIRGTLFLFSKSARRVLYVSETSADGSRRHAQFFQISLPAKPGKPQEDWSRWLEPSSQIKPTDKRLADDPEKYAVRCRVRPA